MRVAFIQNFFEELTGPLILCELLEREGHTVKFFLLERGWEKKLRAYSPEVVALSVCTGEHPRMLQVAALAKAVVNPTPLVIMGGPHSTFFPEVINHPALDAICRGAAENTFPQLLSRANGQGLPVDVDGFWVKRDNEIFENPPAPLLEDLDQLPIPSRKSLYQDYPFIRKMPFRKMITGRGCPHNCNYCYNHTLRKILKGKGKYLRRRSVSHVVDEVVYLKNTFGCEFIDFNDDLFTISSDWVMEFSQEYARRANIPFCCNVRVDRINDQLAKALASGGCRVVKFGLESGDEQLRHTVLNKSTTDEQIRECAHILRDNGIKFQTYNMLGLPGEDLDMAMKTVRINQEIKPFYAWCSLAQPFPGTRLAELCASSPEEARKQSEQIPTSWFDTSIITQENRRQFVNLHKFFALLVRYPWLEPVVKRLIKMPENAIYRTLYQGVYGIHMKAMIRASWWRVIQMYLKLRKQY